MTTAPDPPGILQRIAAHDRYAGAQTVVLAAIALDLVLPERLTIGPRWLLPSVETLLLLALVATTPSARLRGHPLRRRYALAVIGMVSLVNLVSLVLLVHYLLHHDQTKGRPLILAGIVLWVTNVLLFGLWYWQLDRGGPAARDSGAQLAPDFLFPQMSEPRFAPPGWDPGLTDYLYVSFTNATAFSPTDTMPLSRPAKWIMAVQSLASLVTIGLVVARAVNIL